MRTVDSVDTMEVLESIKKQVGARVRELRRASGFRSVEALAERLGVHHTTIYEIERGENWVSPDMARLFSEAFSCSIPALFDVMNSPTKPAKLRLFELIATLDEAESESVLAFAQDTKSAGSASKPARAESKPVEQKKRKA